MRSGRKGSLLRYETAAKNIRKGKRSFADVFLLYWYFNYFSSDVLIVFIFKIEQYAE